MDYRVKVQALAGHYVVFFGKNILLSHLKSTMTVHHKKCCGPLACTEKRNKTDLNNIILYGSYHYCELKPIRFYGSSVGPKIYTRTGDTGN